jgi:hypothetical protein
VRPLSNVDPDFTSNTNGDDGSASGWASHHHAAAPAPIATSAKQRDETTDELEEADKRGTVE